MKFSISVALSTLLANFAAADFQIYAASSITGTLDGGQVSASGFFIFDGPPSCDDVCNSVIFIPSVDDASEGRDGIRCEGCSTDGPITELEFHNVDTDTHWTLYQSGDYYITPADGGPLLGQCFLDSGDDYSGCSCGIGNAESGHRLFICNSDLTPEDMGFVP